MAKANGQDYAGAREHEFVFSQQMCYHYLMKSQQFIPGTVNQYNKGQTHVVPVIASFSNNGSLRPMLVEIRGARYKVEESWAQECGAQIIFHCTVANRELNTRRELCITYHTRELCWTIKY